MSLQQSDKKVTFYFSLLHAAYFCVTSVQGIFFTLILAENGFSEAMIGRVATITSMISLVSPMVVGQLCDRFRLNRTMFVVAAVSAPVLFFLLQNTRHFLLTVVWAVLFYALVLSNTSVSAGWVGALNAGGYNVDFGFTRSWGSLSYAVSAAALGFLVDALGMRCLPYVLVVYGVFLAIPALKLPAPPKQESTQKTSVGLWSAIRELAKIRPYVIMLAGVLLFSIPSSAYFTYFALYFTEMGGSASLLGIANFVLALVEVPVMLFYSKLEKRWGVYTLVTVSILGYGLKNICLAMAPNVWTAIACLSLQVFGLALSIPASQSMIASCTPAKYSGTAQSIYYSVQGIGSVLANLLCSWLVSFISLRSVFHVTSYFSFIGALLFVACVCIPMAKQKRDV